MRSRMSFTLRRTAALAVALAIAACTLDPAQEAKLPHTYLEHALTAAQHRDAAATVSALDQAEQAWGGVNSTYGVPEGYDDAEAIREIARARQSVDMGRWDDALYYIQSALTHPSTIIPY